MPEWMITTETGVSVAVVVTLIGCTVAIVRSITGLKRDVKDLKDNQYTITMACEHALRTALANPNMVVPDPRNPSELISVRNINNGSQKEQAAK